MKFSEFGNKIQEKILFRHMYFSEIPICFIVTDEKTVQELQRLRVTIDDFDMKDVIGHGHFGKVHVVRERCSGDVYAMKILRKSDTFAQQNVST